MTSRNYTSGKHMRYRFGPVCENENNNTSSAVELDEIYRVWRGRLSHIVNSLIIMSPKEAILRCYKNIKMCGVKLENTIF